MKTVVEGSTGVSLRALVLPFCSSGGKTSPSVDVTTIATLPLLGCSPPACVILTYTEKAVWLLERMESLSATKRI